jgi:hypothetical protein
VTKTGIDIDSAINDSIPLRFVYDTTGVYFLASQINKDNTNEFEYCVLLNNKTVVTSWTQINKFTQTEIGSMKSGIGIVGS